MQTTLAQRLDSYIIHHVADTHEWHLPFLPPIHLPPYLSLHGLMVIFCALLLIWLFCFVYRKDQKSPTGITNALEVFVLFIRDQIATPCLGREDGLKMTPFFCTLFFFILGLNLIGMVPLFSTATANINVTAGLSLITLFLMTLGTMFKNGVGGFFKALIPSGVPIPILLILVPIEFIGIFIKCFALTIRLFANMFAGHMVVLSILGIVIMMGYIAAIPAVFMALFISCLELLVAFLQAYIFTFLSAMFIGQMHHPQH